METIQTQAQLEGQFVLLDHLLSFFDSFFYLNHHHHFASHHLRAKFKKIITQIMENYTENNELSVWCNLVKFLLKKDVNGNHTLHQRCLVFLHFAFLLAKAYPRLKHLILFTHILLQLLTENDFNERIGQFKI